ncbi:hypothetical protein BaRGS_00014368 [Batillaria attramentaria]|uniref:Uncharacterized protein n=1 Tax=Batillaria attramentaria TaxID=370345 RepID=A0ABD0L5A0_9CAEN
MIVHETLGVAETRPGGAKLSMVTGVTPDSQFLSAHPAGFCGLSFACSWWEREHEVFCSQPDVIIILAFCLNHWFLVLHWFFCLNHWSHHRLQKTE